MIQERRWSGTSRHIYSHWPAYLLAYSAIILSLLVIGLSIERGWWAFVDYAAVLLVVVIYFLLASLWSAHELYDREGLRPHHRLFDLGQIQDTDVFVCIDLGLRWRAISLGRRLTTGHVSVIDVYHPQLTPGRALVRGRTRQPAPPDDPRFSWLSGSVELLPLPDNSVTAVVLCQVLSEFWQEGDRLSLLREAHRILVPNGRLLLAEPVRSQINWLVRGTTAWPLKPAARWRELLDEAGFDVSKEQSLLGLIHCFCAHKQPPAQARPLPLELP
ncbi:MAG: class I SAM-dependent methyltransferase [Anaerolineae bacterium]